MAYMKPKQIAETLKIHVNTVYLRLKEMQKFVGYGKEYPPSAMLADDGMWRVDLEAFMDFCNRRGEITTGKRAQS